jgi:hypothetical protein
VAHDHRLADLPSIQEHAHDQDVLQRDELRPVLGDENDFGGPALVRRVGLERRAEAHHLQEIEAHSVRARHREDRAPVALVRAQARLVQAPPGLSGRRVERHGRAARRRAARLERLLVERPGEDELLWFLGPGSAAKRREKDQSMQNLHVSPQIPEGGDYRPTSNATGNVASSSATRSSPPAWRLPVS